MTKFHPRRADREITDSAEHARILKAGKYAIIGMADGNEPYVVTLNYGYDAANARLYFHCALKGLKLDFLEKNPEVCATVIEDHGYREGQCEHAFASLIIRGKMRLVTDLADKKHGLGVLLRHLEPDPEPILARNIKDDASYAKVGILRLDVETVSGKQYL